MSDANNDTTKKAAVQPAEGADTGGVQASGIITPKTDAAPATAPSNPPKDKAWYEQVWDGYIQQAVDEQDGYVGANRPKNKWGVLGYGLGMSATLIMENPPHARGGAGIKIRQSPGSKQASQPKNNTTPAPVQQQTPATSKGASGNGGGHNKNKKRKPRGKCELMKFEDMDCKGGERHHVVPDFVFRYGRAVDKHVPSNRPTNAPTYNEAPVICITKKQHLGLHKQVNAGIEAAAKAGIISLGTAKDISVKYSAIASGCPEADIRRQLDNQIALGDDTQLRGVVDSKKVPQNVLKQLGNKPPTEK